MDRHVLEWNASPLDAAQSHDFTAAILQPVSGMERICIETSGHGR
jgi:hypothetical protein